ncbi:hypothetical protein A2971_01375 [Candidatus Gottesmanbacteria bacterium RIFCSPLOWO2_01_FULL_46_21]|uniref:acylphosphatase n=1 Tax=Candidatus Gottesmanbacteria bacterium RIFCSPLOWO2_01_FULL_46_21 TaxID=1798393 RepID=A0A1F6AYX2_9BACT|nr:MAG: hypothetical protein A2971_01375 [Candidatus Gottesmanbacteria bacterium RIFCSPLOWO2_01_FULL_46_21]
MSSLQRVHLIISGDVQGVGFRAWVRGQARDLGCVGWVKNRQDEGVEVVAEGMQVEELVKRCQKGPDVSLVEKVDTRWSEATGEFVNFSVVY